MAWRATWRMLNLDQVHTFIAVASHLHFGKAAEELYLSQPAVSAAIAKLECQLGVPLFHRIGRRVQLTDAGRHLQREGKLLIEQAQRLELDLEDFSGMQRGSLHLGASFTVGNYWLPIHLARFRGLYPAIHVQCELGNAKTILAEAIWMVRSPNRQDSQLLNHFVALIHSAEDVVVS